MVRANGWASLAPVSFPSTIAEIDLLDLFCCHGFMVDSLKYTPATFCTSPRTSIAADFLACIPDVYVSIPMTWRLPLLGPLWVHLAECKSRLPKFGNHYRSCTQKMRLVGGGKGK